MPLFHRIPFIDGVVSLSTLQFPYEELFVDMCLFFFVRQGKPEELRRGVRPISHLQKEAISNRVTAPTTCVTSFLFEVALLND